MKLSNLLISACLLSPYSLCAQNSDETTFQSASETISPQIHEFKTAMATRRSSPRRILLFDGNVPAALRTQILNDLHDLKALQGTSGSKLHQDIFSGPVDGPNYISFFSSRVKTIGFGNNSPVSYAIAFVNESLYPSKMWLTHNYVKFSMPWMARMLVVFHESRHTEPNNNHWTHVNCPNPFKDKDGNDMQSAWTGVLLAGKPGCDATPSGSYGLSVIMLKNIQKFCSNCPGKVRMDAEIYGDDQLKRIITPDAQKIIRDDLNLQ